jgi:hypothetical protein
MKKIVLLLAALVLFSSFVYADVGVGIWGRDVFILALGSNPAEGADAVVYQGWGPDWGGAGGPQMGIAVWWTSDLMEYHFKYKYNNNDVAGSMIPEAWGLLKLMPAYGITLQLGYREEQNDFRETTPVTFHDMNAVNCGRMNGWSAVVMIEPPDMGLKVGIQYRMPLSDMQLQYNIYNIGIGASYTVPEMVKITVGSMVDAEAWEGDGDALFPSQTRNIFGRIHLLMVPDLTLWLLVKYTGLEPESVDAEMVDLDGDGLDDVAGPSNDNTVIELLLGAKYSMGDFSIASGIDFKMTTPKADGATSTSNIEANIDPAYNLGKMAVGAVIGLKMEMDDDGVDEGVGLYLEPYVKIPDFNMNISFKYAMNNDLNPDTDDYSWSLPVQVDFSFW